MSWSLPEVRERDCYGGNPDGYVRRRLIPVPIGHGFGRRAMSDDAGLGLVERARDAAAGAAAAAQVCQRIGASGSGV